MFIRCCSVVVKVLFFFMFVSTGYAGKAEIEVNNAWVRGVPVQAVATALYMDLHNKGKEVELVSVESDFFSDVQIHQAKMKDGIMSMQELQSITVPSKKTTVLKPMGLHIMLFSPREALIIDQKLSFTLVFSNGNKKRIQAPVKKQ